MLKRATLTVLICLPLFACSTAKQAAEDGARGLKLAALDAKDAAVDFKDATLNAKDGVSEFFDLPQPYHGRGQAICGYLSYHTESHNIFPDAEAMREQSRGFGVQPGTVEHQALLGHHGKYVCLSGEVYYRGCGKEVSCNTSDFLYAVRVNGIGG